MPTYTFRCASCGEERTDTMTFAEHDVRRERIMVHLVEGVECGIMGQVLDFHYARSMPEHYSDTLDMVVKSERHYKDELKRSAEEYSIRTGLETSFELVDPTDPAAAGVKGDVGFESQAKAQHDAKVAADGGHKSSFVMR